MKIEIDSTVNEHFKFNFESQINSIIKKIPKEHIFNLHKIQVLSDSPEPHRKNSYGFYYGQREGEKFPKIVICVNNIFDSLPKPLLKLSFIPKLFLARTIFHEVAHHYQRLQHGIDKQAWEKNADHYVKKMMNCHFKLQLLSLKILFGPFILIKKMLPQQTDKLGKTQ